MAKLGGSKLTWLGHATIHIQTAAGTSILVDPWLEGNPSLPKDYRLPETIDLLLLTHGHDDHFHDAAAVAKRAKPQVIGIMECVAHLAGSGVETIVGMNFGGSMTVKDVRISVVEAVHTSSVTVDGKQVYAGHPCGFVLAIEGAPAIYLAGDTALFGDMKLIGELYRPEIAVLPIGDHYTMGPKHAAIAAKYLGAKTVVPVHYGTFPALTGTPAELKQHLEGSGVEMAALKPGERLE